MRFGGGQISPVFASYYLGDSRVREWIVRHAHGATMPNLNTSILSALPFVVPPPEEQQFIARILGVLDDKIDLNRRMNETLMFNIIGAMAEFERELIRERVKAGMKNAKAKGVRIGRPRAKIDASQIACLRDGGASLREIAARLGVSLGTVASRSKRLSRSAPVVG